MPRVTRTAMLTSETSSEPLSAATMAASSAALWIAQRHPHEALVERAGKAHRTRTAGVARGRHGKARSGAHLAGVGHGREALVRALAKAACAARASSRGGRSNSSRPSRTACARGPRRRGRLRRRLAGVADGASPAPPSKRSGSRSRERQAARATVRLPVPAGPSSNRSRPAPTAARAAANSA